MRTREAGIIKVIMMAVVGVCVLFIVMAMAAQYVAKGTSTGGSFSGGGLNLGSYNYQGSPSPLLPDLPGDTGGYGSTYSGSDGYESVDARYRSPHAGKVILSRGSAGSTSQPNDEYVTIRNIGEPVSISGWVLTNGKGTRPLETSQNSYFYPTNDSATIGQGTEFLDGSGNFVVGPIVLKKGDNAIVTTGPAYSQFSFSIYTSFRENTCLGYLEYHPFSPPVSYSCPHPTSDPAIRNMTEQCYDYISNAPRCRNPELKDRKRFDETLTTQCKTFIRERMNYAGCVAYNRSKPGFTLDQWRIFLGKGQELWASRNETITLYDRNGLIVDQVSY